MPDILKLPPKTPNQKTKGERNKILILTNATSYQNNPNQPAKTKHAGGRSSSLVRTLALRCSQDVDPNHTLMLDFNEFDQWLRQKYANSYRATILCYARKFYPLVVADNLRELDMLPTSIKSNAVKGLIVLSKYLGIHKDFTNRLKEFDIKVPRPDSLSAFLRILNASNSNIMQYYNEVTPLLRDNERLFAKFLLQTGLRDSEGIESFNLIIKLASDNKLAEYYDENLGCLCHFKYPKTFIRGTKNAYITFVSRDFLEQIAMCETVTYSAIRKRLEHIGKSMRFNEFRDYFGTHLVNNGILEIEQNLVCGRIPIGIFIRHYWSPKLKELGARVLTAIAKMETTITN